MTINGVDHLADLTHGAYVDAATAHAPERPPAPAPRTDVATIPRTLQTLRSYFEAGNTRPLGWRQAQLTQLRALLAENADAIVEALRTDLGKPPLEGWMTDVSLVLGEIDLALRSLPAWTRPERIASPLTHQPAHARIVREPLGVVLIIAPWNYPVQLLLSPLVGALAAGNCAVLKPSEVTPHVSALLGRLVPRYLDRDGVAIVEGGVAETTVLLAERFDHVFYTGNGRVGRAVMEAAAKHLTPVTLELGGKSPCLVDERADVAVAARRIVWGKFMNAGQTCIAPDYVLVHAARETELLARMGEAVLAFYGEDPRRSPDYGRIVNVQHHRRLAALLKDGEAVVGGAAVESERYIAPTILRNVSPDAPVMQDEIFGPILPVLPISSMEAAIAFVNARPKPLALYVFTGDAAVEARVVERTSSGGVCVNGTMWHIANPALPFGGVGASGMGAYHGRATFETFSHRKPVVTKSTRIDPSLTYPPYGAIKAAILKRLI